MEGEEAVKIFDLVVKSETLPTTLDKLVPLSFIGAAAVKFYQAKVKLMDQLGMSEEQRKATLADGQDAGEMLLNIEARIGELIEAVPEKQVKSAARQGERSLPVGINKDRSRNAQSIHRNPAAVAAVIKEARENEDIPTRTAVINRIRYDKEKARQKSESSRMEVTGKQMEYIAILEQIVTMLPKSPPKDWTDKAMARAVGLARIIISRLEEFDVRKGTERKEIIHRTS